MTPRNHATLAGSDVKTLAETVREAAAIAAQHADDVDRQSRFPSESLAILKAGKALSAYVPRELGGAGLGLPCRGAPVHEHRGPAGQAPD